MLYYRVKPEFDNTQVLKRKGKALVCDGSILVGNELYTEKELARLTQRAVFRGNGCKDNKAPFEAVNISKRRVYWFFGARFESKGV